MLVSSTGVNPDLISPFEAYEDGYAALESGQTSLLGYQDAVRQPELLTKSIAQLMLSTPSSAVMHFEKPQPSTNPRVEPTSNGIMMAANYHAGHSEGDHKIILQDPAHPEMGQWLLWVPPGSNNRTFYRRVILRGIDKAYRFEECPTNRQKIKNYFIHAGASDEAISSFRGLGYVFEDRILGAAYDDPTYEELRLLSSRAGSRWDPLAAQ